MDDDGCIYIKINAIEFPRYRPPKPGHKHVIHGADNKKIYSTIDHTARAPTPLPECEEEEEDVMGHLPDRVEDDEDDEF